MRVDRNIEYLLRDIYLFGVRKDPIQAGVFMTRLCQVKDAGLHYDVNLHREVAKCLYGTERLTCLEDVVPEILLPPL